MWKLEIRMNVWTETGSVNFFTRGLPLNFIAALSMGEVCLQKSPAYHQDAKMVNNRKVLNNF